MTTGASRSGKGRSKPLCHMTPLELALNTFHSRTNDRKRARQRAEEAATALHEQMLAALDRGESIEEISDQLRVPEAVADQWLGSLVRGRDRFSGGIPAPLYNAEKFSEAADAA